MSNDPGTIFEYDPDKPPRTSAIILIVCGLLAVGFLVLNVAFTGEDPYQNIIVEEDDRPIQEGGIIPNVWRANKKDDLPPEPEPRPKKKASTSPWGTPRQTTPGASPWMSRPATSQPAR